MGKRSTSTTAFRFGVCVLHIHATSPRRLRPADRNACPTETATGAPVAPIRPFLPKGTMR